MTITAGHAAARPHDRPGARGRLGVGDDDRRRSRIAAALLAAFVTIERRTRAAARPARHPARGPHPCAPTSARWRSFGGYVGFQFVATLYLQSVLGWSALETALAFLPAGLLVAFGSTRVGPLVDRFGTARC